MWQKKNLWDHHVGGRREVTKVQEKKFLHENNIVDIYVPLNDATSYDKYKFFEITEPLFTTSIKDK
jgi:hypothetical protein